MDESRFKGTANDISVIYCHIRKDERERERERERDGQTDRQGVAVKKKVM